MAALLPDMLTGDTRLNEPAIADYLKAVMDGSSVDGFIGGAVALAERPDFTDMLPKINVPTLVIVGLKIPFTPCRSRATWPSRFPSPPSSTPPWVILSFPMCSAE